MKKLILILLIVFAAESLKSQPLTIDANKTSGMLNYMTCPDYYSPKQTKSSQARHLKSQIAELLAIGTFMFVFRDDLQEFSIKHDKLCHLVLSYGLSRYFGWRFAAGFMLAIELTQIDVFGISGRYEDTAADLFMDGCGIAFSFKF